MKEKIVGAILGGILGILCGGLLVVAQTPTASPLTFPDVFTPNGASATANQQWVTAVQTDLNSHETRLQGIITQEQTDIQNLQEQINTLKQQIPATPPALTSATIPVTAFLSSSSPIPQVTTTSAGTTIWNTTTGQVISYAVPALAPGNYTLTIPVQAAGSSNSITVRVNNGTDSMPQTVNPPSAAFPIAWPGNAGTIQIVVRQQWVNLAGNMVIQ